MLKTLSILLRGSAAAAEEDLADRNALPILDQQIREVAASIEAGKRALALALAQEAAEARRLAAASAELDDLETRAVAALQGGREDLAAEAAAAILAFGADRDRARDAHAALRSEVQAMRQSCLDASRRLLALQRGRSIAQAGEAARRLRAGRHSGSPAAASLADAEATLARLRARQAGAAAAAVALDGLHAEADPMADATLDAVVTKLGAAGFGKPGAPGLADVMARLRAKAAAPAAQPT